MESNGVSGRLRLYVDGACSTNPGPMSLGVSVRNSLGQEFHTISRLLPELGTNNIAEYEALLAGLNWALENGYLEVEAYSDSEVVVYQILGDYQCRVPALKVRLDRVRSLISELHSFRVRLITAPVEKQRAHDLAKAAFDTPAGRAAKAERRKSVTFRTRAELDAC